jgi:phytoene dehydrogenase-like protein
VSSPIVIIGGGINGLTAATLLSKKGRKVLVLEANNTLGGLASKSNFHEGFHVPGILHDTARFRPVIEKALNLSRFGLKRIDPPPLLTPQINGTTLSIEQETIKGHVTEQDRENYATFRGFIKRISPTISKICEQPAPNPEGSLFPLALKALRLRLLGRNDMIEILRVGPMCVGDWMRDRFQSEALGAAMAYDGIEGCFLGPWSAGTAFNLLISCCLKGLPVQGGPHALVETLRAAAEEAGAEIRTDARVAQIHLGTMGITGLSLSSGEKLETETVAASCDPKQLFLRLMDQSLVPTRLLHDVKRIRARGTSAKIHLALDGPLKTATGQEVTHLRTGCSLNALEKAFDASKYRLFSSKPVLDVTVPSMTDPSLCPEGKHVVSIMAHAVSYDLKGGWDESSRSSLADAVLSALEAQCPNVSSQVMAREILTPQDLEQRFSLTGGHIHHGEHALDQLLFMRPTAQCARHKTPVPGLYLCGSGSHPGGGITGAPGWLGAQRILKE